MEFSSVRPRYESVRAARLYYAADCLLPADSWHRKSQASGASSTHLREWQHFPQHDFQRRVLDLPSIVHVWGESVDRVPPRFAYLMASWVPISFAMFQRRRLFRLLLLLKLRAPVHTG